MTVIDTPEGIAFVQALARRGALEMEIRTTDPETGEHMKRTNKRGAHTAYSIVKQVYGFRGSRQSVLEDLNEYIEAELRLRKLSEAYGRAVAEETQRLIDWLTEQDKLDQQNFESVIAQNEQEGYMNHEQRQAMSDLFYVMIVRRNAGIA